MKAVPYGAPLDAARKAERQKLMDEYMAMLRKPPPSAEGGKSGPSPASLIEKEIANAKNACAGDVPTRPRMSRECLTRTSGSEVWAEKPTEAIGEDLHIPHSRRYCADLANKMIPYCKEDATPAVSAV
jgi:hypothetical protein